MPFRHGLSTLLRMRSYTRSALDASSSHVFHVLHLDVNWGMQNVFFMEMGQAIPRKLAWFSLVQATPNVYLLARPRARWYRLRGLPLVGSECVCPQCNSSFVIARASNMPSVIDLPVRISSLKSSQETSIMTIELPDKMYPTILCRVKCPMPRPQRYSTLQKPISGYQTTNWLRQSGFDKHSCLYVGQRSNTTSRGQFHHDLTFTTYTGREQGLSSSRVITNESSSKPRTTRHTSNCACNLPKPRPHMDCVVQYNSHPYNGSIDPGHAPSTHSLGDKPPAVAASSAIMCPAPKFQVRKTS